MCLCVKGGVLIEGVLRRSGSGAGEEGRDEGQDEEEDQRQQRGEEVVEAAGLRWLGLPVGAGGARSPPRAGAAELRDADAAGAGHVEHELRAGVES